MVNNAFAILTIICAFQQFFALKFKYDAFHNNFAKQKISDLFKICTFKKYLDTDTLKKVSRYRCSQKSIQKQILPRKYLDTDIFEILFEIKSIYHLDTDTFKKILSEKKCLDTDTFVKKVY